MVTIGFIRIALIAKGTIRLAFPFLPSEFNFAPARSVSISEPRVLSFSQMPCGSGDREIFAATKNKFGWQLGNSGNPGDRDDGGDRDDDGDGVTAATGEMGENVGAIVLPAAVIGGSDDGGDR